MVGYTCVDIDVNPNFGLTSFDNFLYGALLVFRVFTFDQVWPASVRAHVLVWKPARELIACVPSYSIPTITQPMSQWSLPMIWISDAWSRFAIIWFVFLTAAGTPFLSPPHVVRLMGF